MKPRDTGKPRAGVSSVSHLYGREVMRQPLRFALVILGAVGAQACSLIIPLYMRQMFNTLVGTNTSAVVVHQLVLIVMMIGLVMLLRWASYRVEMWCISQLEVEAMSNLTTSSFEYLIRHSHQFFASQFAGTLTRRVNKYANAFESIFDSIVMNFFPTALFVLGAIGILFYHNRTLGIILGIWSVAFVCVQIYLSRKHRPLRVHRAEQDSKLGGAVADAIGNQSTITLFSGAAYEYARLKEYVGRWARAQLRSWHFMEYVWGAQGLLMLGINIALLYGAVQFWQRGELTIGDFILIQTYLMGTFDLLGGITQQLRRFYDALADAEEMAAILEEPHDIRDIAGARTLNVTEGRVDFKDVGFYFRKEKPVLSHFNLGIRSRQKVALVGPSGAGKTTITKLVLRLYDVTSGEITIDGQNIAAVMQESLRNAIAFVPQEPVLFHRTLMENIRYGRRDASDDEVYEAARKAHCHEFISALPDGYQTFVGERGVKLSGGERQRVAIARAILKNAPLLVLDEATSSLDSESEALIQDSLKILMEGKTVLVIAHRLSTIMHMDRIVVLEGGAIVADGTHQELLERGGLYQKLWSIQAGGFIADEEE
jgi:ATP-binding cassette subfamily B protein